MIDGVRIVRLPACKMASSGWAGDGDPFADGGVLRRFDKWWSAANAARVGVKDFAPRDFLWFDREKGKLVWYYALPDGMIDTGGFDVVDYEGGLYAARVSKDGDEADAMRVYDGIKEWVAESGCFELDEYPGHYDMCNVITPPEAAAVLGYHQLEIYVPIKIKDLPR